MISIKKDAKGNLKEATGVRSRANSMYKPGQTDTFKISRSKFSDYMSCKRCFYLDRVKGLASPGMPGWSLNIAVDDLLKKEFDEYRKKQQPHPIFKEYNLNFIPYEHEDLDKWRNSLVGGISYHDQDTNLIIQGGVDDIWYDLDTKKLVVLDYKAQSSNQPVEQESYLESVYHQGYKMQLDFYVYVLRQMGFDVNDDTYFMVCNGEKTPDAFNNQLIFTSKLIKYKTNVEWISGEIKSMKALLDSKEVPGRNPYCENCAYIEQGNKLTDE